MDDRIKLGVLWKNLSRTGNKPYLSGRVQPDGLEAAFELLRGGGRFLVLSNNKRPDKKDPDCVLFVVPDQEHSSHREPAPQQARQATGSAPQRNNYARQPTRSTAR